MSRGGASSPWTTILGSRRCGGGGLRLAAAVGGAAASPVSTGSAACVAALLLHAVTIVSFNRSRSANHHSANPHTHNAQAVATTVNLHIESLVNLPRTLGRRRTPAQLGVVAVETLSKLRGATSRALAAGPGSRAVAVRETIKVELPRKEGMIRLEVGGSRL